MYKTCLSLVTYEANAYFVRRDHLAAPEFTLHYRGLSDGADTSEDLRVPDVIKTTAELLLHSLEMDTCTKGAKVKG